MKPQYNRLTATEFNRAIKHLNRLNSRLTDHSLELARQVLVDGMAASALARQQHCTAQLINRLAAKVHQAFIDSLELPPGWVSVRVELPADEAQRVVQLEKQLKQERKTLSPSTTT